MAKVLYTDYTTAKDAVDRLYRATIGTYSWRYDPGSSGRLATAQTVNELETAMTTAAARVVSVNCGGYHTANYSSANNGNDGYNSSTRSYNSFSSRNSGYRGGDRYY